MRLAVCFSGVCSGSAAKNVESHRKHFDGDFFFGTWDDSAHELEEQLPGVEFLRMPEVAMHYHPIVDFRLTNDAVLNNWMLGLKGLTSTSISDLNFTRGWHRTKQHLAHALMVESLPRGYDLIVRSRYDTRISEKVDFKPYLSKAFDEHIAIGFGKALGKTWVGDRHDYQFDAFRESRNCPPRMMSDFLIIHRRDMFDPDNVWKLHKDAALLPAETGWWQLLSGPNGGHVSILGGATLERFEAYR